jgi:3-oxoadipate enol-lactonase
MNIEIGGVRFDVLDEGRGAAIVLLHGFPLAKETWDAQAQTLRGRARVVRFDLRGLGRSSVPPGPYLMETVAGDVAGIMDALGIERAVIAGHSLGGYVAFAFHRMFSERCAGLGIVCSRANADDPVAAANRLKLADRAEREGISPIVDAFVPRYFAPAVYEREPELVARARSVIGATDPRGAAAMLRGMATRVASFDLLAEIDVPVGVVAGASDAIATVAEARAIASGVPRGSLRVLDCGHFPAWETPDELTDALGALLDEAEAPG